MSIFMTLWKRQNHGDKTQNIGCQDWGWFRRLTAKEHEGTCVNSYSVPYLNWGSDYTTAYICQDSSKL